MVEVAYLYMSFLIFPLFLCLLLRLVCKARIYRESHLDGTQNAFDAINLFSTWEMPVASYLAGPNSFMSFLPLMFGVCWKEIDTFL